MTTAIRHTDPATCCICGAAKPLYKVNERGFCAAHRAEATAAAHTSQRRSASVSSWDLTERTYAFGGRRRLSHYELY